MKKKNPERVSVLWYDSYGVTTGWQDIADYTAGALKINSVGFFIYEDKEIISLAHNYARETKHTPEQANGIIVIPKVCIIKFTSFPSYRELGLKRKRQHF